MHVLQLGDFSSQEDVPVDSQSGHRLEPLCHSLLQCRFVCAVDLLTFEFGAWGVHPRLQELLLNDLPVCLDPLLQLLYLLLKSHNLLCLSPCQSESRRSVRISSTTLWPPLLVSVNSAPVSRCRGR